MDENNAPDGYPKYRKDYAFAPLPLTVRCHNSPNMSQHGTEDSQISCYSCEVMTH